MKYPDLNEKSERFPYSNGKFDPALQNSTEIITDEICLEDENEKRSFATFNKHEMPQKKDSLFTRLQIPRDSFMEKREVEIKEVKTTTEWLILEQRVYLLRTFKRKNEGNELQEMTEVERRFSDFEWLTLELKLKYPGIIIPPLPDKNALAKINLNETNNEFLETRKRCLVLFLQKLLKHPDLRYAPELRKFIEETTHITKENSEQILNPSNKTMINSFFSYVSSFWQSKKVRENNKEDLVFEKERKFLEVQQQKLNEIVKSLHNLFSNKKEEKKTYGEMSSIFANLEENEKLESTQSVLQTLKEKTEQTARLQDKKTKDFIEIIEIPLKVSFIWTLENILNKNKENSRYLGSCIEIIDERKTLEDDIFNLENAINDMKAKGSKEEEQNLERKLSADKKRLESLTTNLTEDLKNFKVEINNDINSLLKVYKEMQIKTANEMFEIWKPMKKEWEKEKEEEKC